MQIISIIAQTHITVACKRYIREEQIGDLKEIGQRVGRNQATVCDADLSSLDAGGNDGADRTHLVAHHDRRILRLAVMNCAATSRTVAQQIQSVTHHSVSARTIQRRLQQSGKSARRALLRLPLTGNHTRLHRQWGNEQHSWTTERNGIVFTDKNPTSAYNTTMVGFEFGDTVVRGCWTVTLCIASLVLLPVSWFGVIFDFTAVLYSTKLSCLPNRSNSSK
ncbi:transposable element Tcb1 transposase [Trichonephila clavipes]|nr:transposable element Tcb1 transposase [Trichonephila clavipes]